MAKPGPSLDKALAGLGLDLGLGLGNGKGNGRSVVEFCTATSPLDTNGPAPYDGSMNPIPKRHCVDCPPEEPRALTTEEWQSMSPREQQAFLKRVNAILTEQAWLSPEARAHGRAKNAALDRLGQHFSRLGTRIYLADEMAVHYPGEAVFVPDILAVLDVEDPGDEDERLAWVVADEGRGLDLVLEVLYRGSRTKDLVRNVERYARLGIGEYFVYDRANQAVLGWQLSEPGVPGTYHPLRPRFGRLGSRVLGLELAVLQGRLRFFYGMGELPGSGELVEQLGRMVDELEERRAQAEQAQAQAEQAQAQAEQAQAQAEQELQLERERGLEAQRWAIGRILEVRELEIPEPVRAAIAAQADPEILGLWIVRAAQARTAEEVVEPD
ncbi:MAG: Uma2 family endonuclease [Deltaproteobacteria bacterium]|nr:Uma2 family endonuclease [Deltaproteobacteria bacterium]